MYQSTAYVYPTRGETYSENGQRETVPGRVDLVLTYPAPEKKNGERTFTFEGRTPKQVRKILALMKHGPRGVMIGDEQTAAFLHA